MTEQLELALTLQLDPMGIWRIGLFVGTFFCMLWILRHYAGVIGKEAIALWAWLLGYCLYTVEFPLQHYGDYNAAFLSTAGMTTAEALLIPIAVLAAPRWVWKVMTLYMWVSIAAAWAGVSLLTPWDTPSPSFDTALLALYLPFAGRSLVLASLLTIVRFHGSTALTIVLAELLALSLSHARARWALAAAVPIAAGVAYLHSFGVGLGADSRIEMWKKYMSFWVFGNPGLYGPPTPWWYGNVRWDHVIRGTGPGSFLWITALLDGFSNSTFFMHNEFLQIAFELGTIGELLALGVYIRALRNAWERPRIRAAIFGSAAFCATYHPLRFFAPAFVMGMIFREALKKKKGPGLQSQAPLTHEDRVCL